MTSIRNRQEVHALRPHNLKRHFKIQLAIFASVNVLLLAIWAVAMIAGAQVRGELWPWPVAVAIWGAYVAVQGYRAYRADPHVIRNNEASGSGGPERTCNQAVNSQP